MNSLPEIKNYLQIEHTEDDMLLLSLEKAATEFIKNYTNQSFTPDVPHVIKIAHLQMIHHWYDNRSPVTRGSTVELPLMARAILDTYRNIC